MAQQWIYGERREITWNTKKENTLWLESVSCDVFNSYRRLKTKIKMTCECLGVLMHAHVRVWFRTLLAQIWWPINYTQTYRYIDYNII